MIIDTDPGHDDALALIFAVLCPDIDLEMVSVSAGNAELQKTFMNAKRVMNLLDSDIEVVPGEDSPLERDLETAVVHGESGLDGMPQEKVEVPKINGIEKLKSAIESGSGRIVTLGPLTNIGKLLRDFPEIKSEITDISVMGGAVEVPGNQNRVSEFNMFVDPEAAREVFEADLNITMVPLDPCNDIVLSKEELQNLPDNRVGNALRKMFKPYMKNLEKHLDTEGALVYDALAVYATAYGSRCDFEDVNVVIEAEGKHTRGMTVADRRSHSDPSPNCRVVNSIDSSDFKKKLASSIDRGVDRSARN